MNVIEIFFSAEMDINTGNAEMTSLEWHVVHWLPGINGNSAWTMQISTDTVVLYFIWLTLFQLLWLCQGRFRVIESIFDWYFIDHNANSIGFICGILSRVQLLVCNVDAEATLWLRKSVFFLGYAILYIMTSVNRCSRLSFEHLFHTYKPNGLLFTVVSIND